MNIKISRGALRGTVQMISSKSDAHRLFIGAALADQPTEMMINGSSEDLEATLQCLQALGADFLRQGDKIKMFPVEKKEDLAVMDCGESGSTLRFLLPVAGGIGQKCIGRRQRQTASASHRYFDRIAQRAWLFCQQ